MVHYPKKASIQVFLILILSTQTSFTKTWYDCLTTKNLVSATAGITTAIIIIRAIYLNYTQFNNQTTLQESANENNSESESSIHTWKDDETPLYEKQSEEIEKTPIEDAFDRTEQAIIQFNLDYY